MTGSPPCTRRCPTLATRSSTSHASESVDARRRPAPQASDLTEDTIITLTDTTPEAVLERCYRLSDQVVIDRLGDSMVAVQLGTDKIFELNETAARLVELLSEGRTAADAAHTIAGEYQVALAAVREDVVLTIGTLMAESMIEPVARDI